MTDDLLAAVHNLTRPTHRKLLQDDPDDTKPPRVVKVVDKPLLEQLIDSITATIGIGGSGSAPNERNMLNNEALFKAVKITELVKDWAHRVDIQTRPADLPGPLLDQWYVLFTQKEHGDEIVRWHINKLESWARQIEAMFDPPRTRDLPNACPVCEADTWWKDGAEYARPLVLTFHEGPRMIEDGKGMCRACEATFGLRELSYAIDEREAKLA